MYALISEHSNKHKELLPLLLHVNYDHHCSMPTVKSELSQSTVEPAEEPEVTDDQLDSDKELIYQ